MAGLSRNSSSLDSPVTHDLFFPRRDAFTRTTRDVVRLYFPLCVPATQTSLSTAPAWMTGAVRPHGAGARKAVEQ